MRIAYVLRRFPVLSQTFVAEAILSLENAGWEVEIFSLLKSAQKLSHNRYDNLTQKTIYAPKIWSIRLLYAQIFFLLKAPKKYIFCLFTPVFRHWRSPLEVLKVLWTFPRTVYFAKICKDFNDVKHVRTHWLGFSVEATKIIATLLGAPYSIQLHTRRDVIYGKNFLQCLYRASFISVECVNVRDAFRTAFQLIPSEKVILIRECFSIDRFNKTNLINPINKQLTILGVGRLVEKKGFIYLIQACSILEQQGLDFRCLIVGDGPQRSFLQSEIYQMNVQSVTLLGVRANEAVIALLGESHIVVQPSIITKEDEEGLPTTILEAFAAEKPVISTPVGGIPDVVKNGETGLIVPQRDPIALAEALNRLMNSAALRQEMGKKGRQFLIKEFAPEKSVLLLSKCIQKSCLS